MDVLHRFNLGIDYVLEALRARRVAADVDRNLRFALDIVVVSRLGLSLQFGNQVNVWLW